MKWDVALSLHIENLIPGLLTLFLASYWIPADVMGELRGTGVRGEIMSKEFAAGAVLVALAYLLGAMAVALSRAIIDPLSRATVQPALLWAFDGSLREKTEATRKWRQKAQAINRDYRKAISHALQDGSDEIKAEVLRRRERGRLVRTALVPAVLGAFIVVPGWGGLPGAVLAFLLVLLLYGYLEVTIYQEAKL